MRDSATLSVRASERSGESAVASTMMLRAASTDTLARSMLSRGLPDLHTGFQHQVRERHLDALVSSCALDAPDGEGISMNSASSGKTSNLNSLLRHSLLRTASLQSLALPAPNQPMFWRLHWSLHDPQPQLPDANSSGPLLA